MKPSIEKKQRWEESNAHIDRKLGTEFPIYIDSGYPIWAPLSSRYTRVYIYAFDVFKGATLSLACRPRALLSPTKHPIPLSRREQCRAAVTCSTFDHYSRSVHKIGKLRRVDPYIVSTRRIFLSLRARTVNRLDDSCRLFAVVALRRQRSRRLIKARFFDPRVLLSHNGTRILAIADVS